MHERPAAVLAELGKQNRTLTPVGESQWLAMAPVLHDRRYSDY